MFIGFNAHDGQIPLAIPGNKHRPGILMPGVGHISLDIFFANLNLDGFQVCQLLPGDSSKYSLDMLDEEKDWEKTFYKERWIVEDGLEHKLIVSFSLKYQNNDAFGFRTDYQILTTRHAKNILKVTKS